MMGPELQQNSLFHVLETFWGFYDSCTGCTSHWRPSSRAGTCSPGGASDADSEALLDSCEMLIFLGKYADQATSLDPSLSARLSSTSTRLTFLG